MVHDDMFAPESVDEQVDRLLSGGVDETSYPHAEALVRQLRALYEEDQGSVGRVWARLEEQLTEREELVRQREVQGALASDESSPRPEIHLSRAPVPRLPARAVEVAAAMVTAILVASLLLTFHLISAGRGEPTATNPVGIATPPGIYVNEGDAVARLDNQTHQVIWDVKIPGITLLAGGTASAGLPPPLVDDDNTVFVYWDAHVLALNATTGAQRWSRVFPGADLGNNPPYLDNFVLYVPSPSYKSSATVSGTLFAVDPLSGAITATYTGAQAGGQVSDGVLYYQTQNFIYVRQLPGDTLLWQWQDIPYANPQDELPRFVGTFNGVLYVQIGTATGSSITTYGFDLQNGTQLWKLQGIGVPFFSGGMMYACPFGAGQSELYAFETAKTAPVPRLAWKHTFSYPACSDVLLPSSLVSVAGTVYFLGEGSTNGHYYEILTALRASDGTVLSQREASIPGQSGLSIVGVDSSGTLYVSRQSGQGYGDNTAVLFAMNPRTGDVLWQIPDGLADFSLWGVAVV